MQSEISTLPDVRAETQIPLFSTGRALPYIDSVDRTHVESLATASAYIFALECVAQNLYNFRSIRFAREHSQLAFASALYGIAEQYVKHTAFVQGETAYLDAYVRLELLFPSFREGVNALLPQSQFLQMHHEFLEMLQKTVQRGEHILAVCIRQSSSAQHEIVKTLPRVIQRIEALWLYYKALKFFNGVWSNPETVYSLLQESLNLDKRFVGTWIALGEVQLQMDQALHALESLNMALSITPNTARALYARGLGHLRLQQPVLAEADFRAALAQEPNNAAWLRASGVAHMMMDNTQAMCQAFEKACALGDCEGLLAARKQEQCLSAD